jgi:FAD-dependent oxidoreductase domain-containing protein 1
VIILFQVKTESREIRSIKFGIVIIAAGPYSEKVTRMARIGTGDGMLSIPLPVEPRYRIATLQITPINSVLTEM